VLGVEIGGMSRDAAEQRLRTALADRAAAPITLSVAGASATVPPAELGLGFDPAATVESAGGRDWQPARLFKALFGDERVDPVVTLDQARFASGLAGPVGRHERAPREGGVVFRGTSAVPVAPVPGTQVDRDGAADALRAAYLRSSAPVVLPMTSVQPKVGREEVERALREFAEPALSAPVTVTAAGKSVELPPALLAPALAMRAATTGASSRLSTARPWHARSPGSTGRSSSHRATRASRS
jgi:hypothetical protein